MIRECTIWVVYKLNIIILVLVMISKFNGFVKKKINNFVL